MEINERMAVVETKIKVVDEKIDELKSSQDKTNKNVLDLKEDIREMKLSLVSSIKSLTVETQVNRTATKHFDKIIKVHPWLDWSRKTFFIVIGLVFLLTVLVSSLFYIKEFRDLVFPHVIESIINKL